MPKSAKKRSPKSTAVQATAAKSSQPATPAADHKKESDAVSKQSRVVAMLQSSAGVSIAAMMKATGWQQHSVRGFLAGVVRKRLNLKLSSQKLDGNRVYRIAGGDKASSKRRSA
jgi:hypothetical protein